MKMKLFLVHIDCVSGYFSALFHHAISILLSNKDIQNHRGIVMDTECTLLPHIVKGAYNRTYSLLGRQPEKDLPWDLRLPMFEVSMFE